jgi:AcrR family transcriptional regulator
MTGKHASRPGRPRSDIDGRALDVALGHLVAHGYTGLSVDAVAQEAGVAKTTLYRRWPTKDHLAVAVIARMQDAVEVPDTGDIRADLTDYLEQIALGLNRMRRAGRPDEAADDPSAGLVAELAVAAARHNDIGELLRAVFAQRNAVVLAVLERARQRGELRPDTEPEVLFDQLAGALYYRLLVTGQPIDRAYAQRLVHSALTGVLPAIEE